MKKTGLVSWVLSITVPFGLAWSAGYVLSSMKKQATIAPAVAKNQQPQIAAPLLNLIQSPEVQSGADAMKSELQTLVDRGVAADAAEPLQVLEAVSDGGLTRTIKIYDEPSEFTEDTESAQ